jgi:hypothetical protein
MDKFDAVFLGNGATAVAVMYHYWKKSNGEGKYLLIAEAGDPQGALLKGVKTVNLIVPKLPELYAAKRDKYQTIVTSLRGAASSLEQIFEARPAYSNGSATGFRVCRSKEELHILQSLQGTGGSTDDSLAEAAADFVARAMGHKIDKDMLFPYEERIWDVDSYIEMMADKLPVQLMWDAEKVYVEENENGIQLEVEFEKRKNEKILAAKLVVCKGVGNIPFENDLRSKSTGSRNTIGFRILPFSKLFYEGPEEMPASVSSIMLPANGVCVTKERASAHSLLYNTNVTPVHPGNLDIKTLAYDAGLVHKQLREAYPSLPVNFSQACSCAMTVDPLAYSADVSRHFQFVKWASVVQNIHYLNLPYFTVIRTALQYLPDRLSDF